MLTLSATLSTHMCRRLYGEVWGVEGKDDRKPLGVCGWLATGVVGAELLGTAVVALGIQFGAHRHIQELDKLLYELWRIDR